MVGQAGGFCYGSRVPVASDYTDSLDATVISVAGASVVRPNGLAKLRLAVGAGVRTVTVTVANNYPGSLGVDNSLGAWLNGTWLQALTPTVDSGIQSFALSLDGAAHTLEIGAGWCQGGTQGAWPIGVAWSGGTVTVLPNPTVARRLVVYGDSISNGGISSPMPRDGWLPRLRVVYPGRIALNGWGGRALYDDHTDLAALATRLVGLLFTATTREIYDAIGINDWAGNTWSASAFGAACGQLYDLIHATDPTIRIYSQTPLLTTEGTDAIANVFGNTPPDYRTAKAAACAGRSWVTPVDGMTLITGSLIGPGGIHPNAAGQAALATSIGAIFGLTV